MCSSFDRVLDERSVQVESAVQRHAVNECRLDNKGSFG
jgi:hypothetical protein